MTSAHPPPAWDSLSRGASSSAICRAALMDAPETSIRAPTGSAAKRGEACPRSVDDAVGVGESTRVHCGERICRGVGAGTAADGRA